MSIMVTEVHDALVSAGAPEDKAKAAAAAEGLVTKQDMAELRTELKSDMKVLKFFYAPAILVLLMKLVFFPA